MRMATCDHCGEEADVNHSDGSSSVEPGEYCAECWDELELRDDEARNAGPCARTRRAEVLAAGRRDNITRAWEEDR